jgi:hypothetical protein
VHFEEPAGRALLHLRVDQLERRLAQLEEQLRQARTEQAEAALPPDSRGGGQVPFGRRSTDPQIEVSEGQDSDAGREGARLVALEMLSAGYRPEQVATYLRDTFGVDDPDAVLAEAGPASG